MKVFKLAVMWACLAVALEPGASAAGQDQLPDGEGKTILEATCISCHSLGLVTEKRASRDEWNATVRKMTELGAVLQGNETSVLIDYLSSNFGVTDTVEAAAGPDSNDRWVVNQEWAQLPAGMTWDASTSSIAADGEGNVVVLVRTAPHFRVFSREGQFVRAWGDAGLFQEAHSVMFDGEGFIWATDSNGHVVYKFSPDGTLLMTLGRSGTAGDDSSRDLFNRPNAVAIAPDGDIFVSDGYVSSRIAHFSKDGQFIRSIGGVKGTEPGQLQLPHGVVLDSTGRIIVGDSDNKRISVFDRDGNFVETWPIPSRGGMLITADDTVYVSDVDANAIHVVKDGQLVETIGGLGRVHGITLDSDGSLYASDSLNRAVMKITPRQ